MTNPADTVYTVGDRVALAYYMRRGTFYPLTSWVHNVGVVDSIGVAEAIIYFWSHDYPSDSSEHIELMTNVQDISESTEFYELDRRFSVPIRQTAVNRKGVYLEQFCAANNVTSPEAKQFLSDYYFPQVVVPQSYTRMCTDLARIAGSEVNVGHASMEAVIEQARSLGYRGFRVPDNYVRTRFALTNVAADASTDSPEF